MQFTTNQQRPMGDVTAVAILSKCRDSSVTLTPAGALPTSHHQNSPALGDEIWNLNDLKEPDMTNKLVARIAMIGMLFGTFTLGYVCGSVSTPRASAQLPGGLGGTLGAAGQLGSSITDMEKHVSGLQTNLDTLKKIQSALTGK